MASEETTPAALKPADEEIAKEILTPVPVSEEAVKAIETPVEPEPAKAGQDPEIDPKPTESVVQDDAADLDPREYDNRSASTLSVDDHMDDSFGFKYYVRPRMPLLQQFIPDSNRSSTVSIRSSIYDHVKENGRTYHRYKEGKYFLPNDEQEQDRLDLQHHLLGLTLKGRLYLAPIKDDVQNVLDIATGTGIWAIEFAQDHSSASVVGTDLSAIQPLYVPPNCRFEVDDAEDEWTFSTKFDFIHGRALLSCFNDSKHVFQQAYNALVPGGYLELQDGIFPMQYVGDVPENCALKKWNELILGGAAKAGRAWTNVQHYKRFLEEIGFEDVEEKSFYWPTSPWAKGKHAKQLAMYFQEDMLTGIEGMTLKVFTGVLGWTPEQVQVFLVDVRKDLKDLNIHAYLRVVIVYGRKPGGQK